MATGFKMRANGSTLGNQPIDSAMVRRACGIFLDADHSVFLQALPAELGSICLPANDTGRIISWIESHSGGRGVYFSINPTHPIDRPMRVADAVYRRWILIDIDRNKTLQADDSATENEHSDAGELAFEVMSYLSEVGFPAPHQVDSGNGHHLYYRINLPNDETNRDLVHDFLKLLDSTFSDARGSIGAECFDARRISRMPGTWTRRGKASKERQYRQCKFTYTPIDGSIVPIELLQSVVGRKTIIGTPVAPIIPPAETNGKPYLAATPNGFEMKATSDKDRDKQYGRAAIDDECGKLAAAPPGERHNQLVKSSFALWELMAGGCLTSGEVKDALFGAAVRCGLDKDKEHGGDGGILKTIESCREKGMKNPRNATSQDPVENKPTAPVVQAGERIIVLASEVTPRKIQWLWQGRIPLGKLTTFAGSGGLGKTFVLTDIAARVTRGEKWPDGASGNVVGSVLYISGEDDPEDTLVPRLIACGGVRELVAYFKSEHLGKFSLENIPMLDMALDQLTGCLLVCIDPPTSFLGDTDDHKNAELRKLLTPLSEWATRRRVAVIFITHINKGGTGKVDAMMRIIGSVAWSNAVRAAHMFARDPDEPDRRLFIGVKINGARERKGMAYRIHQIDPDEIDGAARVEWLGEVETTANDAMAGMASGSSRCKNAAAWLVDKFREKLEWESDILMRAAKEEGISRNAMFEAKDALDLPKAKKVVHLGGDSAWVWWVPADWSGFASYPVNGPVGTLDQKTTQADEF